MIDFHKCSKLFLRYLIFIVIPFFIGKKIETSFWANSDDELKREVGKKPLESDKINKLPDSTQDILDRRGGDGTITVWLIKIFLCDLPIKAAIAGAVGSIIWSESADNAASLITRYGNAIVMAPGKRLVKIADRLRGINPDHTLEIREILLNRKLGNQEKVELLRLKIDYALKNLTGRKRTQFILAVIAMIAFLVGTNFTLFAWFMERLRDLIGHEDNVDSIREYLIELYKEYNAPIPEELVQKLPDELITKIVRDK